MKAGTMSILSATEFTGFSTLWDTGVVQYVYIYILGGRREEPLK